MQGKPTRPAKDLLELFCPRSNTSPQHHHHRKSRSHPPSTWIRSPKNILHVTGPKFIAHCPSGSRLATNKVLAGMQRFQSLRAEPALKPTKTTETMQPLTFQTGSCPVLMLQLKSLLAKGQTLNKATPLRPHLNCLKPWEL